MNLVKEHITEVNHYLVDVVIRVVLRSILNLLYHKFLYYNKLSKIVDNEEVRIGVEKVREKYILIKRSSNKQKR